MKRLMIALCAAAALLFACKKTNPAPTTQGHVTPRDRPIILDYACWGTPDEVKVVEQFITKFEAAYPDIGVNIIHLPDYYTALNTLIAGYNAPDVMYMGLEDVAGYADKGVIIPIDRFFGAGDPDTKYPKFNINDFYPNCVDAFRFRGKTWGVPKDFTPLVLYYNKDLFDYAGLSYPDENWAVDDFLNAATNLTEDIDGDGIVDIYGFVAETWTGEWAPWLWTFGGEMWNRDVTKCLLADPQYIDKNAAALRFLQDLIYKYKCAPSTETTASMGNKDMFMTGRVAMCTYGRWMAIDFQNIDTFRWDVAFFPFKEKRATTLFTVCYAISTNNRTPNPEAAWKLVKFLTGEVGQSATAHSGLAVPTMIRYADSPDFLQNSVISADINNRAYIDCAGWSRIVPSNVKAHDIGNVYDEEIKILFSDPNLDPKTQLIKAQRRIDRIMRRR